MTYRQSILTDAELSRDRVVTPAFLLVAAATFFAFLSIRLDVALAEATADERRAREELAAVLLAQFEPWTEAIRREWRECDEISAENLAALVESERRRGEVHAASRWLEDYVSAGFSGRLRRRGGGRVTPLFEERVHRRAVSGGRSLHRPSAMAGCNERRAGGSRRARGPKSR